VLDAESNSASIGTTSEDRTERFGRVGGQKLPFALNRASLPLADSDLDVCWSSR
jgi:hypothetical protein